MKTLRVLLTVAAVLSLFAATMVSTNAAVVYATVTGYAEGTSDNNHADEWGEDCWKLEGEDFGNAKTYELTASYDLVIVKAGSEQSAPGHVNTLFANASAGETVFADSNGSGLFDEGDKGISHIIFCGEQPEPTPTPTPVVTPTPTPVVTPTPTPVVTPTPTPVVTPTPTPVVTPTPTPDVTPTPTPEVTPTPTPEVTPTPTPEVTPTPTPEVTPTPVPDVDCDDFPTQEAAQEFFEANGGPEEDPFGLDGDGDGIACDVTPTPTPEQTLPPTDTVGQSGTSGSTMPLALFLIAVATLAVTFVVPAKRGAKS